MYKSEEIGQKRTKPIRRKSVIKPRRNLQEFKVKRHANKAKYNRAKSKREMIKELS